MNEAGGAWELEAFPAGWEGPPLSLVLVSRPPGLLSLDPQGPSLRSGQQQGLPEVLIQ